MKRWPNQNWPIGVKLLPESDLGLPNGVQGQIDYPTGLPLVGAANIVQTPVGPRMIQAGPNGSVFSRPSSVNTLLNAAVLTATAIIPLPDLTWVEYASVFMTVLAVSGTSPTMAVQLQFSADGGTTWITVMQSAASLTAVAQPGLVVAGPGINMTAPGGITAFVGYSGPIPPLARIRLVVGGTTPSYTLSMWGVME